MSDDLIQEARKLGYGSLRALADRLEAAEAENARLRETLEHQQWRVIVEAIEKYSRGRSSDLVALGIVSVGVLMLDDLRRAALSQPERGS